MDFIKKLEKAYRKIEAETTSSYFHGSPKDHGDILEVLPYGHDPYGHDFGGIFLSQESKWGHIGVGKNYWYYIDLKDSEILQLSELYYHHTPKDPKIKKVLEFFDLFDTPYAIEKRQSKYDDDDDDDDDLDFIWNVICGKRNMMGNDYVRLCNIAVLGEQAEWEIQTIQGQIAKELGFKAVEMTDERGTAFLLVGPNTLKKDL